MTKKEDEEFRKFEDRMFAFLRAQREAEEKGQKKFICPICSGEAWWGRAPSNNHLHCGCKKCGIKVIQ